MFGFCGEVLFLASRPFHLAVFSLCGKNISSLFLESGGLDKKASSHKPIGEGIIRRRGLVGGSVGLGFDTQSRPSVSLSSCCLPIWILAAFPAPCLLVSHHVSQR